MDNIEVLRAERDMARARLDTAVKILAGIHGLLMPSDVTTTDGRAFCYHDPDPHKVLRYLTEAIRAIPDELSALRDDITNFDEWWEQAQRAPAYAAVGKGIARDIWIAALSREGSLREARRPAGAPSR